MLVIAIKFKTKKHTSRLHCCHFT